MSGNTSSTNRFSRTTQDEESFGKLLGRLANDSSTLVRSELMLAKRELSEKVAIGSKAAALLLGAGLLGLASVIFFGMTALELLALVLPRWAAALIIALGLVIVAGIVAGIGVGRLKHTTFKPEQTIETLEEDKEWLKKLA
jgi:uncharacterized membrane protein YqjE